MVITKAALKAGGVTVAGICDIDSEHLSNSAEELEQLQGTRPKEFKEYQDLLDMKELDAVFEDVKARAVEAFQAGTANEKQSQAKSAKERMKRPCHWNSDEITRLAEGIQVSGTDWTEVADHVKTRTRAQCKSKNQKMEISDGLDWVEKRFL